MGKIKLYLFSFLAVTVVAFVLIFPTKNFARDGWYGNYGGPGHTGGGDATGYLPHDFEAEPIDSMDELFRDHDKAWWTGHEVLKHKSDVELLKGLENLSADPRDWDNPPPQGKWIYASQFRLAAIAWLRTRLARYDANTR